MIVFAQNTQDLVNALTWARQNDVALRIRSGRHSLEGWSNVDSGLVIDISELKSVHIDSASRIATVGSGLNQLEAVTTLAKQNFAVTLVDAITGHLEHYAAAGQHGHVFVGPQGGQLRRSNFRDDWVKARKDAGVTAELHFHDLRHTGNTLASTAGASTRELMTRVGHSGSRAALIYQHMTSDRDRAIADQGRAPRTRRPPGTTAGPSAPPASRNLHSERAKGSSAS
ncbi:FAD-binding protein [Streptomyces sp. RPA4-2]|uniref:FAD-binding protein n=1 Tax=Streptomyces sp. RPA4-2 TaxID=2721244 RepID=UPI0024941B3B|nr:FAD-binding protein [Streptomyces sp. RPA4-2]